MEIGIAMAPDGTPQTVCWTANDPFDIDLHWATVPGLGAIAGPLIGFGVLAFTGDPRPRPHPGNGGGDPENPRWPPPPQTRERVHIRYGVRVPTFVVSPWVKPGKGPSLVLDHCSILKTVSRASAAGASRSSTIACIRRRASRRSSPKRNLV